MSLQEENEELEELRQEVEKLRAQARNHDTFGAGPPPGSRDHRRLRNAQTQELEDLTMENNQMAERLQALLEENGSLKKQVERQQQEIKSLEATDKSKVIEEGGQSPQKSKLNLLKSKVSLMQKQIKEDNALGSMLSQERNQRESVERARDDLTARLKSTEVEMARLHDELAQAENQNRVYEQENKDLSERIEELRMIAEAERRTSSQKQEELNEQLMMLQTPSSDVNEGHFSFAIPERASLQLGQDLLSQLQTVEDEVEDETPPVLDTSKASKTLACLDESGTVSAPSSPSLVCKEDEPENSGDSRERLAELQGVCQRLKEELSSCKQEVTSYKEKAAADARREISLREQLEEAKAQSDKLGLFIKEMVTREPEKIDSAETSAEDPIPLEVEGGKAEADFNQRSSSSGVKLLGAEGPDVGTPKSEASRLAELQEELERAQKTLKLWAAEREQSSWSKLINSFMCTSR
ncbi:unnamed protein product [Durusdinium trenchii]|uniref:Uncharacterized protein n=2 Tax=Durusdinium trenchii TaxID=1381693 RepID=A0ABP0R726_9DINO